MSRITARKICDNPDYRCFRGLCLDCNKHQYKTIEEVEAMAYRLGYNRDFISGRINDFMHANVIKSV